MTKHTQHSRTFLLLQLMALSVPNGIGVGEMIAITGMSRSSIYRILAAAKQDMGVEFVYTSRKNCHVVLNWGVLDKQKVLAMFSTEPK